jgi:hypothetical protein
VAGGKNTADHPGRKAANWDPRPGNVTTQHGRVISAREEGEQPYQHYLEVTEEADPAGPRYGANVSVTHDVSPRYGIETGQYRAGPFRTQRRAEIASESLANRAYSGKGEMYKIGGYTESPDEIRANKAGLL